MVISHRYKHKKAAHNLLRDRAAGQGTKEINPAFVFNSTPTCKDFALWGIVRRSGSMAQYESGKSRLQSIDLTNAEYDAAIRKLTDYVGI